MQNESSGMGGRGAEICTNLRLLVMSGDKLHRQKESGRRMGARMERWKEGGCGGKREAAVEAGVERERYYKYRGYSDFGAHDAAKGIPLCRVSR